MKRTLLALLVLISLLVPRGLARDEKEALDEFKKDFAAFKTFAEEKKKSTTGTDEAAVKVAMNEMLAKIKAIKTDGLPADLKDPWVSSVANIEKIVAIITAADKDPSVLAKMEEVSKKMEEDQKKLADASKKYGIEGLDKLGD
jgi:hypothetical protein